MPDTIIKHGDVTIIVHAPTLRLRDTSRKVAAKLAEADVSVQTRGEFATVITYTKSVEGFDWQPPSPNADKRELIAALDEWLDLVPTDLADAWLDGLFPTTPTPQK
jgi:hypothetical protein